MSSSILQNDVQTSASTAEDNPLIDRIKRITSVSEVLRIFGACAVLASLSLFMLEGWSEGNDINRYLKLLGQTGLLTIAGLILSFVIKEFKGARLFFGLGLVSAVTNFTILGALIYSIIPLDGLLGLYPAAVTWTVGTSSQFLLVCIGASALLAVLARFSYSIFARKISGPLTLSFLGLNALLLVPMRGSLTASLLTIFALFVATTVVKKLRGDPDLVMTPETKFAFATLFLPSLIIVGRALSLYHVDELFFLTLSGLAYYALRLFVFKMPIEQDNTSLESHSNKETLYTIVQYSLAIIIACLAVQLLPNWLGDFAAVGFCGILLLFTTDQLVQCRNQSVGRAILNISAILVVTLTVLFAFDSPLFAIKLTSFVTCVALLTLASYARTYVGNTNFARIAALFGTVVTLLSCIVKLIAWINVSSWMTIGLLGMLLIVLGSCYERFGLKLPLFRTAANTDLEVNNDQS